MEASAIVMTSYLRSTNAFGAETFNPMSMCVPGWRPIVFSYFPHQHSALLPSFYNWQILNVGIAYPGAWWLRLENGRRNTDRAKANNVKKSCVLETLM